MEYTNSSLVSYTKISPNRTSPRNHEIDTITIHCVVGQCTVETLGNIFAPASRQASSNYGIGYDGRIGMYCEEKDRSWCSSNAANDHRAITIEVASDTTHPYAVNDKALAALIDLVADICKRNNIKELKWKGDKSLIGQINHQNMTVHRWFANTACPGDYLYNKYPYIAGQVNKKLGITETTASQPETSKTKFQVGDIVNFAGGNHYASASAVSGSAVKASKAKVTAVSENNRHPYHLRAVNDTGAFVSGVYGWVDADAVSAVQTATPTAPATTVINDGTKLTLKDVALYASSASAAKAATKSGVYYVWSKDVINNRIRITNRYENVGRAGQVTGWILDTDARNAADVTPAKVTDAFAPYRVKVTADVLNIRKGAGTDYPTNGAIKDKGIYTIVGEEKGKGAAAWLRLKSGAGYIASDYTQKV